MKKLILVLLLVLSFGLFACEKPHEHKYVNGACECGEKHNCVYVEGVCECGAKENVHTHAYGEWEVVKEATEQEEGLKERTCECGEKQTEKIEKLEHVHKFENGACTCGESHDCKFVDGKCECGKEEEIVVVLVESVELSGKAEMTEGEEQALSVVVLPNEATNKEVIWSSSDETIATVENGLVKALNKGTVIIKAKAKDESGKEATFEIVVAPLIDESTAQEKFNEFLETFPKETNQNLPLGTEEYTVSYEFDKCFSQTGEIDQEEFDATATGKITFTYEGIVLTKDIEVLVYGYFTDVVYEKFAQKLPKLVNDNVTFERNFDDYGGSKIYINESSNADVLSKSGMYNRPFHDEEVTLRINVRTTTPKASRYYDCVLKVSGEEMKVKTAAVMKWVEETYPRNMILYYDEAGLPTQCDDYDATLEWFDANGNALDFNKIAQDPVLGDSQVLTAKISIRGEVRNETIDYFVWNKKYTSNEEKVEDFVNALNWQNIGVYKYKSAAFYENNWGYLPFIVQGDAVRNQDYMLEYTYGRVRTNIKATSTEYVVIHDTAGGAPTHTAESFALNQVQANNNPDNTYISWHFTVGEDGIYQSLPLDEVAYHAGDGSHVYGDIWYSSTYNKADCIGGGNRNGIGIESCINQGADYNVTLRMLAKLVAELLLEFNLSTDRIKQHWNFSGKDCPGVIRHCGRWEEFKNLVKAEYFMKTQLKGIEFEYKSLSPEVMDDEGKIIVKDGLARTVSYKVKVNGEGISKEYEFSSTINAYEDWSDK